MKKLLAKPLIDQEIESLKNRVEQLKNKGVNPCLKIVLVGQDPASLIYTRNKKRFGDQVGADVEILRLDADIIKSEFLAQMIQLSQNQKVHGIIVQLPIPSHLQDIDLENLVPPNKDVDGFNFQNIGALIKGETSKSFISCTPKGIMELLNYYQLDLAGKHAVVIGRSMIVGKPLSMLLTNANATVTLCHSKTLKLHEHTRRADFIFSAVGKSEYLDENYIGSNLPVVVDVGINRNQQGKLVGDVNFERVAPLCSAITPVPGGVGPLTIMSLMQNLLQAAENSIA